MSSEHSSEEEDLRMAQQLTADDVWTDMDDLGVKPAGKPAKDSTPEVKDEDVDWDAAQEARADERRSTFLRAGSMLGAVSDEDGIGHNALPSPMSMHRSTTTSAAPSASAFLAPPENPLKKQNLYNAYVIRNVKKQLGTGTSSAASSPIPSPRPAPVKLAASGEADTRWFSSFKRIWASDDAVQQRELLTQYSDNFTGEALRTARVIVSQLHLPADHPNKTIRPVAVGGVAGGTKFIHEGIFFKLAIDPEVSDGLYLYGGSIPSLEAAGKAASNEIRGANAYFRFFYEHAYHNIQVPMQVVLDMQGFRIVAMPVLPLATAALVYGSGDGGESIHNDSQEFSKAMSEAGGHLHLAEHQIGDKRLCSAGDVEGHVSDDKKSYFLIDLSRTFPPESPDIRLRSRDSPQSVFYRLLRPEFLRFLKQANLSTTMPSTPPLSPDAFTGWGKLENARHDSNVTMATKILHTIVIPRLTLFLEEEVKRNQLDFSDLLDRFAKFGQDHYSRVVADRRDAKKWNAEAFREKAKAMLTQSFPPHPDGIDGETVWNQVNQVLAKTFQGDLAPGLFPLQNQFRGVFNKLLWRAGVAEVFHRFGVNMRHLGIVYERTNVLALKQILLAEMIARTLKSALRAEMRDFVLGGSVSTMPVAAPSIPVSPSASIKSANTSSINSLISHFLNRVIGVVPQQSDLLWTRILADMMSRFDFDTIFLDKPVSPTAMASSAAPTTASLTRADSGGNVNARNKRESSSAGELPSTPKNRRENSNVSGLRDSKSSNASSYGAYAASGQPSPQQQAYANAQVQAIRQSLESNAFKRSALTDSQRLQAMEPLLRRMRLSASVVDTLEVFLSMSSIGVSRPRLFELRSTLGRIDAAAGTPNVQPAKLAFEFRPGDIVTLDVSLQMMPFVGVVRADSLMDQALRIGWSVSRGNLSTTVPMVYKPSFSLLKSNHPNYYVLNRVARAQFLKLVSEAVDTCRQLLRFDPSNPKVEVQLQSCSRVLQFARAQDNEDWNELGSLTDRFVSELGSFVTGKNASDDAERYLFLTAILVQDLAFLVILKKLASCAFDKDKGPSMTLALRCLTWLLMHYKSSLDPNSCDKESSNALDYFILTSTKGGFSNAGGVASALGVFKDCDVPTQSASIRAANNKSPLQRITHAALKKAGVVMVNGVFYPHSYDKIRSERSTKPTSSALVNFPSSKENTAFNRSLLRDHERRRHQNVVVLVGSKNSGKSTIFLQLQKQYGSGKIPAPRSPQVQEHKGTGEHREEHKGSSELLIQINDDSAHLTFAFTDVEQPKATPRKFLKMFGEYDLMFVVSLMECFEVAAYQGSGVTGSVYGTRTRLHESLELFSTLVRRHSQKGDAGATPGSATTRLDKSTVVVVLNKLDLFRAAVSEKQQVGMYFPRYQGGPNIERALEYLQSLFVDRFGDDPSARLSVIVTTAVDPNVVNDVVSSIRQHRVIANSHMFGLE